MPVEGTAAMRRLLPLGLVTTAIAGCLVAAAPARAESTVVYTGLRFVYTKNGCVATGCTTNAQLKYVYQAQVFDNGVPKPVSTHEVTWRGGAGTNKNTCDVGNGWLPNTDVPNTSYDNDYYVTLSDPNYGTSVFGTAWVIRNRRYSGGSYANCDGDSGWERSELMIHSEMTNDHTQTGCAATGDSPTCWEGTNDYHSNGCIKVSFGNIWGAEGGTADQGTVKWYWVHRGGSNGLPLVVRS